jgi:hypothetical protein
MAEGGRRVRAAVIRAVRSVDRALGRAGGSRRVLIEARTPMNLVVLEPIWAHLMADPRVEVEFTAEEEEQVAPMLHAIGVEPVSRAQARWRRYDLAASADPWNAPVLSRCSARINLFHGVAGKYDLDAPWNRDFDFGSYDRVLFPNEDRLRRYVDGGVVLPRRAVLIGFPRLDRLVNGEWPRAHARQQLGLSTAVPTVLFAPTFSIASSLHAAGERIVRALLDAGYNVVVKLHDRSMVPHPKHTAGIDWPARLASFESDPRFVLARDPDVSPCLAAADVLVTDHSTVGFEFALLDRPVIVYDAPALKEQARISEDKWTLLRSMADVVHSPDQLLAAVAANLADPARLQTPRRKAHALFAYPGTATPRALEVVYELLDLVPTAVPADRGGSGRRRSAIAGL